MVAFSLEDWDKLGKEEQYGHSRELFAHPDVYLTPAEAHARYDAGELHLLDVRETYEWELGRIPGARHVEIERLGWRSPTVRRDVPVCFYCRLGVRAALAAQAFRAVGFEAYAMDGGFAAWVDEGFPMDPEDGSVSPH